MFHTKPESIHCILLNLQLEFFKKRKQGNAILFHFLLLGYTFLNMRHKKQTSRQKPFFKADFSRA